MKDAITDALEEVANQTADREPGLPDVGDEDEARGWVAAAVSLFAAATSGAALGADLAHSEVAKCAVTLLIALHAPFRVKWWA